MHTDSVNSGEVWWKEMIQKYFHAKNSSKLLTYETFTIRLKEDLSNTFQIASS
jgi:hypothetical protein